MKSPPMSWKGGPRHDFSPQSTGGIAPNGRRLPANAASDRDNRASNYRQDDRVDPTTWPSQIRLSPRQAAESESLSLPLPFQSCRDDRRASAGDRRSLTQTRASGGCNRIIARALVCGSDRAGLQGAGTIGGPDCRTGAGGLTKIWRVACVTSFPASASGISLWLFRPSVLWRSEPAPVRFKAAVAPRGGRSCRSSQSRHADCSGLCPACPPTCFSRSGLPGP